MCLIMTNGFYVPFWQTRLGIPVPAYQIPRGISSVSHVYRMRYGDPIAAPQISKPQVDRTLNLTFRTPLGVCPTENFDHG